MSGDVMTFPKTWEEYEQVYGFEDKEQIYTNGSRLIQSYRVKQWLDHIERKRGKWIEEDGDCEGKSVIYICSQCGDDDGWINYNFCPNCGADMRGSDNE